MLNKIANLFGYVLIRRADYNALQNKLDKVILDAQLLLSCQERQTRALRVSKMRRDESGRFVSKKAVRRAG